MPNAKKDTAMNNHPANIFRNFRAKYFAIAKKHDFKTAFYVLDKDREQSRFDPRDYAGLLSELIFLKEHYSDLDLDPTLDCGDHCDFRGIYDNKNARFDVTSSLEYKVLEDYEPFQKQGRPYYIALIDIDKRKVDRIVDINFPFCSECGGRLINTLIIGNIEHTRQGTPTQTERVIKVCSNDFLHNIDMDSFEYFVPSMADEAQYIQDLYQDEIEFDNNEKLKNDVKIMINNLPVKHGIDNSLFFSKKINDKIHGCAHDVYTVTDKDGDGYWETELFWNTDLVDTIYPSSFGEIL